ncbi:complex I NDUFA9 subunit family protein [Piscinibacter sakaiensis]|uniref:complex I NDUFA9 subunit family protein n=1 Tax=Piscinibacter sakaiensis TaxID=1547922 RepID=UPI003AAC19E4
MKPLAVDRILILGGSGFVGNSLCARLVDRNGGGGGRITVPSRRPQRAKHLMPLPTVQLRQADLGDERQLRALVAGHDAVINLVAILHGNERQFEAVHVDLPRRLAAACTAEGVRRVIHVSALGVSDDAPSAYLRSKAKGEEVLRSAGLQLTLLRPSVMFGANDRFINLFASMQRFAPVVPLAGHDARMQPVWVEDIASALVACLDQPGTSGQTIECAGPTVFTLGELVAMAGRWAGHQRPVLPLPDSLGRMQAWVMEHLPGTPLLSRDNLLSLQVPNIATGTLPGLESLGIVATDIRSVMPDVLSGRHGPARLDGLRAPAREYGRRG